MPTLDWIGKAAVVNHHREVPTRLLHCDSALSFGHPDAGNLLVQGDNLEALKALLPYYAGRVKCIYIDPPYNTGSEDWVYNDNVNSPEMKAWLGRVVGNKSEDLCRHDKWLCMMYPRLSLLREFISDDGAIFISIDDNEVANLMYLCDEIFGPLNFISNLIWQKMDSPSSNQQTFSNYHDHTIVYAKDHRKTSFQKLPKPEILAAYPATISGRRARLRQLRKNGKNARRQDRETMWFAMEAPDGTEVWPIHPQEGWEGRWAIGKSTYEAIRNTEEMQWAMRDGTWTPYRVEYAPDDPAVPQPSIISNAGQNRQAKALLNEMLGTAHGFETPKPLGLIRRFLEMITRPGDIVMDTFAGSGTTGHAALALNADSNFGLRFLLVELDEGIATATTSPRLKAAINGYEKATSPGELVEGLGSGFRYCTLGRALFNEWGGVNEGVTYADLAAFVFFSDTGSPIPTKATGESSLLGTFEDRAVHLLFGETSIGVASESAGNVLNLSVLESLPAHDGPRIVYAEGCTVPPERLAATDVVFKQVPYQLQAS
jgi:adenine-specific DNA-methyltransferase